MPQLLRDVLAGQFKTLAHPARLRLLSILLTRPDLEACTCELTEPLGLTQPTLTHHLQRLRAAGLVTSQRRGVWTYYRAAPQTLYGLAAVLTPGGLDSSVELTSRGGGRLPCTW